MGNQVYEVNGRRVTKEQYEQAGKEMNTPKSQAEKDLMDFAKAAKERAKTKATSKVQSGEVGLKKGGSTSKWIQKAIKKPGSLRKSLGVKKGEKIPAGKLASAAKKPGKMGQRARLAQTLKGLKK